MDVYEKAVKEMYAATRGETEEAPVLFWKALIERDERTLKKAAAWAAQWMADHCSGIGAPNAEDLLEFQRGTGGGAP